MVEKSTASGQYHWKFCTIGGVTRVNIESGEDIAHLGELDHKLWTVLSCPVKGLEMDEKTLAIMDADSDGKIRIEEVVATAKWLTSILNDPDLLLRQEDTVALSAFNQDNEEAKRLHDSAMTILDNLGLDKDSISFADASDSVAIFAKTRFNGDGVITPDSTDDEALKAVINAVIATIGSTTDRSGVEGVTAGQIEAFYAACADYAAWKAEEEAGKAAIYPYGDNTAAALAAYEAVKDKVADYFMRCKLVAFNGDCAGALDASAEKIGAIGSNILSACSDEIAACPIARVGAEAALPLVGINPSWQAAVAAVRTLILDVEFPGKESITEAEWATIAPKFDAYKAWLGSKKGEAVEALGLEAVNGHIAADLKAQLDALVAEDKALEPEANAIKDVEKFIRLYRDFYRFLKNYVAMTDFYQSYKGGTKAVFQAGTLYIDQRSLDLCIRVSDMGKHADMAGLSGMFIIYCNCTSKVKNETMTIAAVLTDGEVDNLRVGQNAVFYDLNGLDWDAVVTKIVDNPTSIRQAFWSPYRKMGNAISTRISKSAAEKESKVSADLTNKVNTTTIPTTAEQKDAAVAAVPKAPFDIAKFAGIFAAIGMAITGIGTILVSLVNPWYSIIFVILAIVICISGPSMFLAWLKLRKRNLGPVLNANGWAINSRILVNVRFGATLTKLAKYPKVAAPDPFAKKKSPLWCKILGWVVVIALAVAAALYFTDNIPGHPFHKQEAVEEVVEATVEAAEDAAPAEAEAAAE